MLLFGQVNINICSIIKHTHMSQELYMVALDNDASCVEVYFCQGIFFLYFYLYYLYYLYWGIFWNNKQIQSLAGGEKKLNKRKTCFSLILCVLIFDNLKPTRLFTISDCVTRSLVSTRKLLKDSLSSRVLLGTIARWVLIMLITEKDGDKDDDDNDVDDYANNVMEVCHISQGSMST